MSLSRQQGFIDAPVDVVWELLADVDRHPEWWPRVVEVECDGLEAGCTYRQVTQTPFGKDEFRLFVEGLDECRNLSIRCLNTGTFVRMGLAEAQSGTFLEAEMGMEPERLQYRLFDAVAGKRFFRAWLRETFDALGRAAGSRARA
jgi:Polyketide cyclase / dehydrase and lipid transport